MKAKLTHTLPQIRCSEETRRIFDIMSVNQDRTISKILQIHTEKIAKKYINADSRKNSRVQQLRDVEEM